jgi:hypothetical protein
MVHAVMRRHGREDGDTGLGWRTWGQAAGGACSWRARPHHLSSHIDGLSNQHRSFRFAHRPDCVSRSPRLYGNRWCGGGRRLSTCIVGVSACWGWRGCWESAGASVIHHIIAPSWGLGS